MDPIEINAGTAYLRQLRADDLLDDRDTLRANGYEDPDAYIATRAADWQADTAYVWAIAEPATGALLGEVGLVELHEGTARAVCWLVPEQRETDSRQTALDSVLRFGFDALNLRRIHST
jgi:RimJ/RimL family protein N-acetyltransferase